LLLFILQPREGNLNNRIKIPGCDFLEFVHTELARFERLDIKLSQYPGRRRQTALSNPRHRQQETKG
jgi:hypothetical protein